MDSAKWTVHLMEKMNLEGTENFHVKISPWNLSKLCESMAENLSNTFPFPNDCFPTSDGNLQMEWLYGDVDSTLDINLSSLSSHFHSYNNETEEEVGFMLDLEKKEDWKKLVKSINAIKLKSEL